MNNAPKAVVSTTLQSADWNNHALLRSIDDVGGAEARRRREIRLRLGSAKLCSSLREADWWGRIRICVAPLLLGATGGAPMFKADDARQTSGHRSAPDRRACVILRYEPVR